LQNTSILWSALALAVISAAAALTFVVRLIRQRGLDRWIVSHSLQFRRRRTPLTGQSVHVLLCIADHYEPQHGKVEPAQAAERVAYWIDRYPKLFEQFRDADGLPPQHSFFFPIDEYEASHVDGIARLCRAGFGEIELHHHHDNDTAAALRARLLHFKELFRNQHGLLSHHRVSGEVKYGFIHGNWALDNSRPDGRWCGVNNELDVLRETGCYADFTLPSAPSRTQTSKINSIYYAVDDPDRPKSHNRGTDVGVRPAPDRALMLIQGPLLLNWRQRTAPGRLLPRIENASLQASQPPSMERLDLWIRARVQVRMRPDWFFIKLHTHGAVEANREVLLGRPMVEFHEGLRRRAAGSPAFHVHYVSARESYNLARAAEAGWTGSVREARDFELIWKR